ncbi:hypothetical protein [Elizabethkingia miricola]|jgi:hypothetical protein|uniref:hypothetical protein n=1 Tax=Elizabethkingia miricola TaxID=172045 RepID=UPI00389276D3
MNINKVIIECQVPPEKNNTNKTFYVIKCELTKGSDEYNYILERANQLADVVNSGAANHSDIARNLERRLIDSFGGLCAEYGWEKAINMVFDNIASPTPFTSASIQIDIQLTNGEKLEVRSSFPYKGVKFAICNNYATFKNIGPYSNSIKPGEIQKNLYLCVLFDTPKKDLLSVDKIIFTLVGGSTWDMMVNQGVNIPLVPYDDDSFAVRSNYKVIKLSDALDARGVFDELEKLGYQKKNK